MGNHDESTYIKVAKIGFKQAIAVAVLSGVFGVVGAIVQFNINKPATYPKMISFFSQKIPVGSIICSVIEPRVFSGLAGDDGGFDPSNSTWIPADGRNVPGSKYSRQLTSAVPDLRGMFLRGLNYSERGMFRKDGREVQSDNNRTPGDYQEDNIKAHTHSVSSHTADTGVPGRKLPFRYGGTPGQWDTGPQANASEDTHPRNIAVYYYIRIN